MPPRLARASHKALRRVATDPTKLRYTFTHCSAVLLSDDGSREFHLTMHGRTSRPWHPAPGKLGLPMVSCLPIAFGPCPASNLRCRLRVNCGQDKAHRLIPVNVLLLT